MSYFNILGIGGPGILGIGVERIFNIFGIDGEVIIKILGIGGEIIHIKFG
jgi:hypothetical protein